MILQKTDINRGQRALFLNYGVSLRREIAMMMKKKNTFVEELRARGMIHTVMPGTEEQLEKELTTAYVGIDPTADSLHIGHLVSIMMLRHLQHAGHRPLAVLGGATGMIGDPSMKSSERNLLDYETLRHNQEQIRKQLERFLDFDPHSPNGAKLLNNYEWMKEWSFLDFVRDIGKHITVNYMMAKESVKKRLEANSAGLSFTEFTYQLLQGYDYLYLYRHEGCKLQMGGSDQWGNITTGTELIRRIDRGDAFALVCPLITKADGGKFGKTEQGNVWLDPRYTSPYAFYQFWINVSDEDASRYIRIFTMLPTEEIEALAEEHHKAPHLRLLQKRLADELMRLVHGEQELTASKQASDVLFGQNTHDALMKMNAGMIASVMEGVPQFSVSRDLLGANPMLVDLLTEHAEVFPSKGELKKLIKSGGISLNKEKVTDERLEVSASDLIAERYLLIQKGKKNYFLLVVE